MQCHEIQCNSIQCNTRTKYDENEMQCNAIKYKEIPEPNTTSNTKQCKISKWIRGPPNCETLHNDSTAKMQIYIFSCSLSHFKAFSLSRKHTHGHHFSDRQATIAQKPCPPNVRAAGGFRWSSVLLMLEKETSNGT